MPAPRAETESGIDVMRGGGTPPTSERKLTARQWRQVMLITLGAFALYAGFRLLPTGTNLSHADFRTGGAGSLEMCDPANPQFIPVVAMRSPVSMAVKAATPGKSGEAFRGVVVLATASGKPVGAVDLLVAHTRKLHLLIVDETLEDYQHVHPEPGERAGEWSFSFLPKRSGTYRVFADFVPAATGRGLYASADVEIAGEKNPGATAQGEITDSVKRGEFMFSLGAAGGVMRAARQAELAFSITRADGGEVALQPVMDAFAHLVAFDNGRSGFAHLHPNEADLARAPDGRAPKLTFKITFPRGGRYVIWAQVNIAGTEMFVPFWVEVVP